MCFNGDVKYLSCLIIFFFSVNLKNFVYSETFSSGENFFDDFEIEMGEKIECKIEKSEGFNWENGKYVSTRFKTGSYLFEKVEHRKVLKGVANLLCSHKVLRKKDTVIGDYINLNRCYLIKYEGKISSPIMEKVEVCEEFYKKKKLESVECNKGEYVFHPEQMILVSPTSASKNPRKFEKYKDSFVIKHGSCRVMKY